LLFLGKVGPEYAFRLQELARHAGQLDFEICLDRFGSFGKGGKRTLWLGPSEVPEELKSLRQHLSREVGRMGLKIRQENFRPHVTLFRKAAKIRHFPESLSDGFHWQAKCCVLVRSHLSPGGSRYEQLS